jgi:hypothetical protein
MAMHNAFLPLDIHMCCQLTALGWVPPIDKSSLVSFLSKKEAYDYKMCLSSMEGCVPKNL